MMHQQFQAGAEMFVLTDCAKKELDTFFKNNKRCAVRVYLAAGGCSGPRLALALDRIQPDDEIFNAHGFEFCMNKELFERTRGVTVDAGYMRFIVEPKIPLSAGCPSCAG